MRAGRMERITQDGCGICGNDGKARAVMRDGRSMDDQNEERAECRAGIGSREMSPIATYSGNKRCNSIYHNQKKRVASHYPPLGPFRGRLVELRWWGVALCCCFVSSFCVVACRERPVPSDQYVDAASANRVLPECFRIPDNGYEISSRITEWPDGSQAGMIVSFFLREPFPASRYLAWMSEELSLHGWRGLQYHLESPDLPAGLIYTRRTYVTSNGAVKKLQRWLGWWVSQEMKTLRIELIYPEDDSGAPFGEAKVCMEYWERNSHMDELLAKYEAKHGRVWPPASSSAPATQPSGRRD